MEIGGEVLRNVPLLNSVKAWLPYTVPDRARGIVIDVDSLGQMTVLVGPNASGKTALLEAIGYFLAAYQDAQEQAFTLSLVPTLRPYATIPELIVVSGRVGGEERAALYVGAEAFGPFLFELGEVGRRLREVFRDAAPSVLREIEGDVAAIKAFLEALRGTRLARPWEEYREAANELAALAKKLIGEGYDMAWVSRHPRLPVMLGSRKRALGDALRRIMRILGLRVVYVLTQSSVLSKSLIIEDVRRTVVIKRAGGELPGLRVAVFHPGFAYRPGSFEALYYEFIRRGGLPNEEEAVRTLQSFMPWLRGFELVRNVLHVRTAGGARVPVYSLSDGQRAAVFLAILYAASTENAAFLIDTPEAFVHPDGLPVVAELVAQLATAGNQVIVATQSLEFIEELLNAAHGLEVLKDTTVLRLGVEDSRVEVFARWSGETSRRSVVELGADLRG